MLDPGLLHPETLPLQQFTADSRGDTLIQFCLSLCGASGSWCAQGLFEPSEHLWQVQGLILNVILPLLPSFWDFSFALGQIAQLCLTLCNPTDYTVHGQNTGVGNLCLLKGIFLTQD